MVPRLVWRGVEGLLRVVTSIGYCVRRSLFCSGPSCDGCRLWLPLRSRDACGWDAECGLLLKWLRLLDLELCGGLGEGECREGGDLSRLLFRLLPKAVALSCLLVCGLLSAGLTGLLRCSGLAFLVVMGPFLWLGFDSG